MGVYGTIRSFIEMEMVKEIESEMEVKIEVELGTNVVVKVD